MKPPKNVTLKSAEYFEDYKFCFTFSNAKKSVVDFKPIIIHGESLLKFLDVTEFKKIKIDTNESYIYWGEDWYMCFHIESIYNETEMKPQGK